MQISETTQMPAVALATAATESAVGTVSPTLQPGDAKVAITFIKQDKDVDLATACTSIVTAMTGNAAYPAPVPALATLTAANQAFVAAVQANDGGAKAVVARNQARAALALLMRQLAAYVHQACQGDLLALLSSGFPAQRQRSAGMAQPLPVPEGLKVRQGRASGQVSVRCTRVRSARLYQWRYATAQAPTVWTVEETTSRAASAVTGLTPATQYLLQVRALGKQGSSDWSNSAALTVT